MIAAETRPLVSVLICTNREGSAARTVRSVLACGFDSFELLVIDQSTDHSTEEAVLQSRRFDQRVRYFRLACSGKPLALNFGLANARGRYVALTDDDCVVSRGWLSAIVAAFESNPRVGCVFGDVSAPPYDSSAGHIPICPIAQDSVIFGVSEFLLMPGMRQFGIGANMALRAEVIAALRGWDPWIGPGAKFASGDDIDVAVRVLREGHGIHFSAAAHVLHDGFRPNASLGPAFWRNGFGAGAIFAKHLKCGFVSRGSLRLFQDWSLVATRNLLTGHRPIGASFSLGWLKGFRTGLLQAVDRRSGKFSGGEVALARPGPAGPDSFLHLGS